MGIWQKYWAYVETPEFLDGLFVEISGMALDILLLAVLVPAIVWLVQLRGKLQALRVASFLSLQFLRQSTVLLLKAGGAEAVNQALEYELAKGRLSELSSHPVYGNTANLLEMLSIRMKRGTHVLGHRSLDDVSIGNLREEAAKLLQQSEKYTTLFASLRLHHHAEQYLSMGTMLLAMRDYLDEMKPLAGSASPTDAFRGLSTGLAVAINAWFTQERRRPDKAHKRMVQLAMLQIVLLLPYVLMHRYVIGPITTRLGVTYRTPFRLEITRCMVEVAYEDVGKTKVLQTLQLSGKQLRQLLTLGNASSEAISALKTLRTLFAPAIWDAMLMKVLMKELQRARPNVLTVDSLIADSTYVYVNAAFAPKADETMRLMVWARSYESVFGTGRTASS